MTGLNGSPVRESHASRACEAAIKVFQGQLRMFKHTLGHNFGLRTDEVRRFDGGPMLQWT